MTATAQPQVGPAFERLVLFDGVCNFCDDRMRWLLEHDRRRRLSFAALQGETAAELRRRHPEIPDDIDTLVYVDASGGEERVYLRWEAAMRVWQEVEPELRAIAIGDRSQEVRIEAERILYRPVLGSS